MNLKVIDFPNKKYICKKYDGDNVSPVISWNIIPKAKSYAIIMEDPDAVVGNFIHWYIPYISNNINKIDSLCFIDNYGINNYLKINLNKLSIFFGKNSLDKYGYTGPCPPIGTGLHRYIFNIYALDNILQINENNIKIKDSKNFKNILKEQSIKCIDKSSIMYKYK
jgi:Raf kinase inhibitor-like YbhB/YbcL family protein